MPGTAVAHHHSKGYPSHNNAGAARRSSPRQQGLHAMFIQELPTGQTQLARTTCWGPLADTPTQRQAPKTCCGTHWEQPQATKQASSLCLACTTCCSCSFHPPAMHQRCALGSSLGPRGCACHTAHHPAVFTAHQEPLPGPPSPTRPTFHHTLLHTLGTAHPLPTLPLSPLGTTTTPTTRPPGNARVSAAGIGMHGWPMLPCHASTNAGPASLPPTPRSDLTRSGSMRALPRYTVSVHSCPPHAATPMPGSTPPPAAPCKLVKHAH